MSLTTNSNTQNLFFKSNKKRDFPDVLNEVQAFISSKYSALVVDGINEINSGNHEVKQQIQRYIGKYLLDNRIAVEGLSQADLVDKLYSEMAEFSFLTKYIFGSGIEEININSWDDIEVQFSDGNNVKLEEKFDSPEHAINIVRRMLHVSGMVLDNTSPAILGHLSKNIRIAVLKTPLVDEDVGVAASIRIVNAQKLRKEDFIKSGTATDEMMELLSVLVRYGVSTTVAGATSSGKTTLTGWLLTTIPHDKRIFTIENGSRELDLVERDENGNIVNKVVHTITRESEDDRKSISQDDLLDMALRFHPDYIVVGEMRSSEADSAQEAARTGHTVITTIHSNSCESTWRRMVTLCKRKYPNVDDKVILNLVMEAFPIVVYAKQLENKQRRIMEIMECEICADGTRKYHSLYRYKISENRMENGKFIVKGEHEKVEEISQSLQRRLLENGMPQAELNRLLGKENGE
ncbi:MAG: type II/IV secretion system ATPase subunit [Ruminococcaceae bacterium]|nr:type II/IV secretion system ATPase subunit [Oscillospiraceae bacterium]